MSLIIRFVIRGGTGKTFERNIGRDTEIYLPDFYLSMAGKDKW